MIPAPQFDRKPSLWLWRWLGQAIKFGRPVSGLGLPIHRGIPRDIWTSVESLWALSSSARLVGVLFPPDL